MPDFPADWSPPDRDPRPLTGNDLDQIDRYMGGGRVSEAQGDDEIRVFDLTTEIRRLRGANVDVYRLSELHGIVSSALNLLHEDLVDDGDRAEAWETAAEALTTELEPFLAGQPTGEPTEADPERWTFEVEEVGGQQPTDYGTGTEDWAEWHWALNHGVYVVLTGVEVDEDPRPKLADLVARLNGRALVGGRPAAPTRTPDGILRQQVTDAVWRNLGARTSKRAVEATIDEVMALLAAGVAAGPQATPPLPERDEQIATVEAWGWSRDVSHTAWIPPWKPTYTVHVSTSPLCACMHEERQHDIVRGCSWIECDCKRFVRVVAAPTGHEDDR